MIADDDRVVDALTMPLGGVRLTLHRDDGDGAFDPTADAEVASAVSDGDGAFSFGGIGLGDYFVAADLGGGLVATLTRRRSANPGGPVPAGTSDVLFIADPIELTLPETGGETRRLVGIGLVLAGGLLHRVACRHRRPTRRGAA